MDQGYMGIPVGGPESISLGIRHMPTPEVISQRGIRQLVSEPADVFWFFFVVL